MAEDEILRRDIAQSIAELSKVRLERDLAKDSMNELINEHQQALEAMRKEQEINFTALETAHKDSMDRLVRETAQAQEALTAKFQEDLALALQAATPVPAPEPVEPEPVVVPVPVVDISALEKELALLQETVEKQTKQIQELQAEKTTVSLALTEAKSEIIRTSKELKEVQERASREREELASLTPTLASSAALGLHQSGHAATTTTTTTVTTPASAKNSEGNVSKYEFTWARFMYPTDKNGQPHLKQVTCCDVFHFFLCANGSFMLSYMDMCTNRPTFNCYLLLAPINSPQRC